MRRSSWLLQLPGALRQPMINSFRGRPTTLSPASFQQWNSSSRAFSYAARLQKELSAADKAKKLNQQGLDEQEKEVKQDHQAGFDNQIDNAIGAHEELQKRTPWHRDGSDMPPVKRMTSAGAMTKGKLLTTPSRLLKLIIPLTTKDKSDDRKSIEPLALLVHPQQPLSYLERLIQSELPMITSKDGKTKVPDVHFRAEDSARDEIRADERDEEDHDLEEHEEEGSDEQMVDGELMKIGKIESKKSINLDKKEAMRHKLRGGVGEGGVESYSGKGREGSSADGNTKFVRWSSSTEIGDFIRDAARGKEFAVEIEGASKEIRIGVPSFNDRTHYLRLRLRKTAWRLEALAKIKKECDDLAHKSAQRLAMGGFGVLLSWWGMTYWCTFRTSLGWAFMEPVTYLAGLSTIMIGYLWFLYHNREVSYRSALNLTVSRRQGVLYEQRKFDIRKWESLIEEANAIRKEIKAVADEYDVDWDEKTDEISQEVHDALKEERRKDGNKEKDDDKDDEKEDAERRKQTQHSD